MEKEKHLFTRRQFMATAGAAAAGITLTGFPSFSLAEKPKYGGEINVGIPTLPNGMDPGRWLGLYAQRTWSYCYEGLTDLVSPKVVQDYLASGKPLEKMPVVVPNLATSWEISKDGLTYTFHLAKGVPFHNGKEFKAEDVEYCIRRITTKAIGSYMRARLKDLKEVKILDDHTVRMTLSQPMAPFLSFLAITLPLYPKDSLPMTGPQKTVSQDRPQAPGTGPFKFAEWSPGNWLRYERFKDYRLKGLPYIDAVMHRKVIEPTVRFTGLRTGELDCILDIPLPSLVDMLKGRDQKNNVYVNMKDYTVYVTDVGNVRSLSFNMRQPPFSDFRVRKAFALAINREQMVEGAYYDLGKVEVQHQSPKSSPFYIEGLDWYGQDVEQAKGLMKEAGYGKGMDVEIMLLSADKNGIKAAQIMQQHLKKINVNLKLTVLQRAGYYARQHTNKFELEFDTYGVSHQSDPDFLYNYLYSWSKRKTWRNFPGYSNDEMDKLLDMGKREHDLSKRKEIYKKVRELIKRDIPMVPWVSNSGSIGWVNSLKGFVPTSTIPMFRALKNAWKDKA